uniref:Uncharacterized protein n=1 Tax=Aegilops tauschii subsp. strangulata TaxID=200361 RepID=A0A453E398_AEGTS
ERRPGLGCSPRRAADLLAPPAAGAEASPRAASCRVRISSTLHRWLMD